jgi:Family of unknown function (DUF6520)
MKKKMILPLGALILGVSIAFTKPVAQTAFYLDYDETGKQCTITIPTNKDCLVQTGTQCFCTVDGYDVPAHDTKAHAENNSGLLKWR